MRAQVHLNKALNGKPQLGRVQLGDIALNIALGLKPLPASADLAGRQMQHFTEFLRRQVRVFLQGCQKSGVDGIKHMRLCCGI